MHLMLDLETGGTSPGCAIFAIGACIFDPQSKNAPEHTFYEEISHSSCMEIGLRFERLTMDWWKGNAPNGTTHIKQALEKLILWLSNIPGQCNQHIIAHWANSPSFDYCVLKHVLNLYRLQWPYPYWQERDVRTLKAIAFPEYKLNNSHNALDDAINQAMLVQIAYHTLGLSKHENRPTNQSLGIQRQLPG